LCFSYLSYSDSVVCCVFHICHIPTVWYVVVFIFVIFRQCGMLRFSYLSYSDSVVCCVFHICYIPTVWYVAFYILHLQTTGVFIYYSQTIVISLIHFK